MFKFLMALALPGIVLAVSGCGKGAEDRYGVRGEVVDELKNVRQLNEEGVKVLLSGMATSNPKIFDDGKGALVVTLESGEKTETAADARKLLDETLDRWVEQNPGVKIGKVAPVEGYV